MAKPSKEEAKTTAVATTTDVPTDLLAFLSDEEKAEMLALTGQTDNSRADRIPVLRINYTDTPEESGRTIPKGNFVYNQSSKTVDVEVTDEDGDTSTEPRMIDLGVDLGKTPKITILVSKQQYSYYNDDAKLRCNSQVFGGGETPVGTTLKHECRSGDCPRRKEGVDKKEKCTCQHVVVCLVDVDGEQKPALMYVKGASFMPFSDYLKAANTAASGKPFPLFLAPTKLKNSQEKQGSVTYFVTSFNLLVNEPYAPEVAKANYEQAKAANAQMNDYKAQAEQKNAVKQLVGKSAGSGAKNITNLTAGDDDISFD